MQPPDGCDFLVFKGRQLSQAYEWSGPCSALLDGASCVVNHAEFVWPPFAKLCKELRARLLHVYCNSYVTPPVSQAVPPHADDRDVFVLQILGRKRWRVYGSPPIKLPYTDEQVGKHGLAIPDSVLNSPPVIEYDLKPGDVLYMPRGFVHEACCPDETSSWHATLAVATHDWSWTKVFASTIAEAMDTEPSARWREAVPLALGRGPERPGAAGAEAAAEAELERLADFVRQTVSVPLLRKRILAKLESHNGIQTEAASSFLAELSRCLREDPSDVPLHWQTCFVREATRVRQPSREEEAELEARMKGMGKGKCKAKGKGRGSLAIRPEVLGAAASAVRELERRREAGMLVREFAEAAPAAADLGPFDELTQLCLARVGVAAGVLQVVPSEPGSGSSAHADREVHRNRVTACC